MNILCTIAARGGSSLKDKNIREIAGKPLIGYTIEQAIKSNLFKSIVVSTDSDKILEIAKQLGAESWFLRPPEMASNSAGKVPVIRHALLEAEKKYECSYDVIIDLDVTSPLRSINDIKESLNIFKNNRHDNLFSVSKARKSPYFNMVEIIDGRVKLIKESDASINRRQDSPECYEMNASIYIWKRNILLENDSLFLEKTGLYVMPAERSIDIDNELDFKFVEFLMTQHDR